MAKTMWGGRFEKETDKYFFDFQKSIKYDYKLYEYDIRHSNIHILALVEAKILKEKEALELANALQEVQKDIETEIKNDNFKPLEESEDIHTDIQNRVEKKLKNPNLALKLQSLRSRNDQIVFDEKFYCLYKSMDIGKNLILLEKALLVLGKKHLKQKFIGYTHTRRAQAIYFLDYLLAIDNMFSRDVDRLKAFNDESKFVIHIGAGALTGSYLSSKYYNDAIKKMPFINKGYLKVVENPMDNVSDRDFIIEFLSILSIIQMHLSRLSEDLILYSTAEFNFIELPEEFCTGSSLMPHKKNPDLLELIRGYTGRIYGNLLSVLTTMKGLPLTYNRDMQLDKEPLFSSAEILEKEITLMAKFIEKVDLKIDNINKVLEEDISIYATELAEWLVRKHKVSSKGAHDIVGRLILKAEKVGGVKKLKKHMLKELHLALNKKVINTIMNAEYAVKSKRTGVRKKLK
jgi:argininosuccinate lyase